MTNEELVNKINQLENELKQFKYDYSKHQHSNVDGTNLLRKNISLDGDQSLNVGLQQMVQVPTTDVGTSREAIGFATSLSKNDNKGFTNKYDGLQVNYTHKPNGTESLITALRGPAVSPLEGTSISVTSGGSTVTIDGFNFTTNELAGCLINIINSSGTITDCKTISSNTSNVITISGTWSSSVSGAVFIIYRPVYLGSKQFIWQRFYTQEGVDGGIRFGVGETEGGQNGLLYMDSAGDLYWRGKAGTAIKLNV